MGGVPVIGEICSLCCHEIWEGPVVPSATLLGLYLAAELLGEYPPSALLWWVVSCASWMGYQGRQMLPGIVKLSGFRAVASLFFFFFLSD